MSIIRIFGQKFVQNWTTRCSKCTTSWFQSIHSKQQLSYTQDVLECTVLHFSSVWSKHECRGIHQAFQQHGCQIMTSQSAVWPLSAQVLQVVDSLVSNDGRRIHTMVQGEADYLLCFHTSLFFCSASSLKWQKASGGHWPWRSTSCKVLSWRRNRDVLTFHKEL